MYIIFIKSGKNLNFMNKTYAVSSNKNRSKVTLTVTFDHFVKKLLIQKRHLTDIYIYIYFIFILS